jgi:hypothetical protein
MRGCNILPFDEVPGVVESYFKISCPHTLVFPSFELRDGEDGFVDNRIFGQGGSGSHGSSLVLIPEQGAGAASKNEAVLFRQRFSSGQCTLALCAVAELTGLITCYQSLSCI